MAPRQDVPPADAGFEGGESSLRRRHADELIIEALADGRNYGSAAEHSNVSARTPTGLSELGVDEHASARFSGKAAPTIPKAHAHKAIDAACRIFGHSWPLPKTARFPRVLVCGSCKVM